MATFLFFVLTVVGFTNILVHGRILDDDHLGLRGRLQRLLGKYGDLLQCYECAGFWGGLFAGLLYFGLDARMLLAAAFAGAGVMHCYSTAHAFVESKTDFILEHYDEPASEENQ